MYEYDYDYGDYWDAEQERKKKQQEKEKNSTVRFDLMEKKKIEEIFEKNIQEVMRTTANTDPMIQGVSVYYAIAKTCGSLKNSDLKITNMSKQETDDMIDEITGEMIQKYLEM